jgi:hypothetical protein
MQAGTNQSPSITVHLGLVSLKMFEDQLGEISERDSDDS